MAYSVLSLNDNRNKFNLKLVHEFLESFQLFEDLSLAYYDGFS